LGMQTLENIILGERQAKKVSGQRGTATKDSRLLFSTVMRPE